MSLNKEGPNKKNWALLAYIAGDNNLSNAGLKDIQEMCDVGASQDVYVGIEMDTVGEHDGSIRYEIGEPDFTGEAHRTVIERLSEKDTGDPTTLTNFLKWGLERFPADNTLAVIWGHGAGFRSQRRDIGFDDFGSSLDMSDVENAFRQAGISSDRKLAILGFDACLMNMLEVVHHFRDQVAVVVGSQQTEPGDGWPYDQVLDALKTPGSQRDKASQIVDAYIADYKKHGVFDVTQSAVETSRTHDAILAVGQLGSALSARISDWRAGLSRLRVAVQCFEFADYVDLIHLVTLMPRYINDGAIEVLTQGVAKSTAACVVANGFLGDSVQDARGLSIWFPSDAATYFNHRAKYLSLSFAKTTRGWVDFLDAYFS